MLPGSFSGTWNKPGFGLSESNWCWVALILVFFGYVVKKETSIEPSSLLTPLDGSALVRLVMPARLAERYEAYLAPYGFFILFMIVAGGGLWWLPAVASAYVGTVSRIVGSLVGISP